MQGLKDDKGKPLFKGIELIPEGALNDLCAALDYGRAKYSANNWKYVDDAEVRYRAALLRHFFAALRGENVDPESGINHWGHVLANACFLHYFETYEGSEQKPNNFVRMELALNTKELQDQVRSALTSIKELKEKGPTGAALEEKLGVLKNSFSEADKGVELPKPQETAGENIEQKINYLSACYSSLPNATRPSILDMAIALQGKRPSDEAVMYINTLPLPELRTIYGGLIENHVKILRERLEYRDNAPERADRMMDDAS